MSIKNWRRLQKKKKFIMKLISKIESLIIYNIDLKDFSCKSNLMGTNFRVVEFSEN